MPALTSIVLDISTHAPRTGSDQVRFPNISQLIISTHAPRTGSDRQAVGYIRRQELFQPTLPARGATCLITQSPA